MMRVRHALKKRLGSAMIAAIMIFSLLPVSAITLAAETKAVSIKWTVRPQDGDGRGEVKLNAALRSDQEASPAAVMIELSLNAEEAAALEWSERIPEAKLTGNGGNDQGNIPEGGTSPSEGPDQGETPDGTTPDGTTPGETTPDGTTPDGTTPDGTTPDGTTPDGTTPDGTTPDGTTPDGTTPDGTTPDGTTPDGTTPDGTTPDGTTPDSTTPSGTGEDVTGTGDPADTELEPTQTLSLLHNDAGASGAQAVLIEKTDGSGAVLRILLVGESTYTPTLAFTVTDGGSLDVRVDESDVRMQRYGADSLPQIYSAPLLGADGFSDFSFDPLTMTVLKTLPQEITVHAGAGGEKPGSISLDGEGSKEIPFEIALKKLPVGVGQEKAYPFTLTWPSQLTRPTGALTPSGPADDSGVYTILCGDQPLATLTLPEGVTPGGLTAVDSGLTVTLSLAAEAEAADVTLTVDGGAFERSSGAFSEPMTLSAVNSDGDKVSASVTVTSGETSLPGDQDGYEVTVLEKTNLSQTVAWADNNNTDKLRPEYGRDTFYPSLYFTINGVRTKLTEETFSTVGLKGWPEIKKTTDGFQLTDLPTKIQEADGFGGKQEYEVSWSLEPPAEPANYAFVEVTDDNLSQYPSVTETGWYYMQQGTFTFILEARMGETTSLTEAQILKILSNFGFQWKYGTTTGSDSIRNMIENGYAQMPTVEDRMVTISGLWKYNLDGTPITFSVEELRDAGADGSGKLTEDELSGSGLLEEDSGDWFQILCDNSGVPNHSTDTDAVYNGGKLRLVLSGEKIFSAEKRWLDDARAGEGLETRPDVTFTLWRYREGQAYNTAAQVAEVGKITIEGGKAPQPAEDDTGVTETYYYYPVYFDQTTAGQPLPKYDADGYKYIYGVKEEMTKEPGDNNYETLYGVVGDNDQIETGTDKVPYGTRASGDTMLYSGGTLSNRLEDTDQVTAAKRWEAAAYQSEFGDVAVELTLQSKPVSGSTWDDVTDDDGNAVKCYLYSFTAERLSESYTTYRPKYDAQGLLLEYQWVETAVYQGVTATKEAEVREQIATADQPGSTVKTCRITEGADGTRTFTLTQGTEQVAYFSTIESDGTIVNRVDDAIDYHVVKEWRPETLPKKEVTINLYRVDSGSADMELTTPYVSFSFDKDGMLEEGWTAADSGITVTQDQKDGSDDPWHATVHGLPRFDENGRPYEYILLEQENFPEYVTKRLENGDYETTVINGKGGAAIPILVRKVWMDDGDDLHREPVTFTVYDATTNQPVQSHEKNLTVTLENGLWHQVIKVPKSDKITSVDDVYVVETSMGSGADAETVEHHLKAGYTKEALYTTGKGDDGAIFDVTTENHRYQVTYKMELTATSGVEGTFTVTNRRLGSIDLTVEKRWTDGDHEEILEQIKAELEKIAREKNTKLALVFQLQFADGTKTESGADQDGWEITYSGFDVQADTVQVGGEKVRIYSDAAYTQTASSEQVIIGTSQNGAIQSSGTARFFGLPKYDAEGKAVEYTVQELWLDVTNASTGVQPTPVTKEGLKQYSQTLYDLWADFNASYGTPVVSGNENHTKEVQSLTVTNSRSDTKDVTWSKIWKDDFTYNSNLRPDIFLDIYALSHVRNADGTVRKQVTRVQRDVKWTAEGNSPNNWTVTLSGVSQYDSLGYEIIYYAVERTVVAAGDYDYQAVKYSLNGTELGDRDAPVDGAVTDGKVLDLLGENYLYSGFAPEDLDIGQFTSGASPKYPRYALIENGTFTNTLAENYTIEGMKYWSSLPSGWLEKMSLPAVTFNVYRASTGVPDTSGEPVATLTVEADQWQELRSGLGYRYLIWYEGVNTLSVNTEGNLTCAGEEGKNLLPRYDEDGKLYTYVVKESIDWTGVAVADGDKVFTTSYSDFTVTNQYDPTRGSIQVKKFLYLPMTTGADGDSVPEAYPAVTFQLTRQVKIDGDYQNDDTFAPKTAVLTSAQVQSIWDGTAAADGALVASGKGPGTDPAYIWATLQFDGLPLYAPDGSKYQYTVTEVKTQLLGYDTWAQTGNVTDPDSGFTLEAEDKVSVSGLTPKKSGDPDAGIPQVSFKNQQPKDETTFDVLMATKVWEDFNDQFKFRPTQEKFEALLTLTRRADSQSGQNNAIAEQKVAFTVEWTAEKGSKTWTFNIKPADGTTGEFEKYAPNGMPWIYTLSERVTEDGKRLQLEEDDPTADANNVYTPSRAKGQWATVSGSGTNSNFGSLTNSVLTQAQYTKTWEDADGQPITEDYLGFDLTVEFQLQVSERGYDNWTPANQNQYVMEAMGRGFTGTATLTGRVNVADRWSGSFKNLPAVVAKTENGATTYIFLTYRVIETKVSYGGTEQTIPWNGSSYGDPGTGLVTGAEFSQIATISTSTNTLATRELSAEKVWVDGNNQYNTRPGVVLPMTWTTWFVLQRTTGNPADETAVWVNVDVVKLYGGNGSSKADAAGTSEYWTHTFSGLPTADYGAGGATYTYRVRELQPKADGYTLPADNDAVTAAIVQPGGTFNPAGGTAGGSYTTSYGEGADTVTVTNALDTFEIEETPGKIVAVKSWAVPSGDTTVKPTVTFTLQYRTKGSAEPWKPWVANATKTATESGGWRVMWENLPENYSGAAVEYQVVETMSGSAASDWMQSHLDTVVTLEGEGEDAVSVYTFTFTNTPKTSYQVEKKWNPAGADTYPVTLGLYRTTDVNSIGLTTGTPVPVKELEPDGAKRTVTLTASPWTHTFTDLPQYDPSGNPYYYYALELSGNTPVADGGSITLTPSGGGDGAVYVVTYRQDGGTKTIITNTTHTSLTGTKTWKDGGNEGGTRPADLTLTLQRKISGGSWTTVTGVTPTWDKTTGPNTWTYTYTGLPTHDGSGRPYTYRVVETVPGGYRLENQDGTAAGVVDADAGGSYHFTNVRTGTVSLYVTKTWTEGTGAQRPTAITLKLERKLVTDPDTAWTDVTASYPQPTWTEVNENTWSLVYENLPQFNGEGVRYQYRITEDGVPVGYEKKDSANTDPTQGYALENIQRGALKISKQVSGNSGETGRSFRFTVTLTGASLAGTPAADVTGISYTAAFTSAAGTVTEKQLAFTGGVSETITLKHGESVIISGLPAGLSYTVTETEANTEGYTTTGSGWTGTIPVGGTAWAAFENYRHSGGGGGDPDDRVTISGTKTWVDRSDAEGKRPADLELTLYRSVSGGEEVVVNATPVWTKNGNVWTYTYPNLPKFDSSGNRYTYRVTETVPDGYVGKADGYNFTNTLAEELITLTGQKHWVGDKAEDRPDSITVVLYADGLVVRRVTVTAAEDWRYVFEDVPRYDADGKEIQYYVREEGVPAGYETQYSGLDITNKKAEAFGGLQITKQVTGSGAEYDRGFSFTVTLSDPSVNGTYGDLTFVNGVASLTLKHGQSAVAVGLPAGITYTVTETVPEGYVVSGSNQTGVIVRDTLAAVTVVNTRETPETPQEPGDPGTPENPEGPEVPTGDPGSLTLLGVLTALFAGGLLATLFLGGTPFRKKSGRRLTR